MKIVKKNYLKLLKRLKKKGSNSKYDCVVGVSGGRDSTFLLYYIKKF